jgi:hypothetical protein
MTITISPREITDAQEMLNIEPNDCYLEFTQGTVYLCWVTDKETAQMYIDNLFECVDVKLYGNWVDIYGQHEREVPVSLPDVKLFDCRYILATN